MEETIYLCTLGNPSQFLEKMTDEFTSEFDKVIRTDFSQAGDLKGKKFRVFGFYGGKGPISYSFPIS